jgi:hypothetical protein
MTYPYCAGMIGLAPAAGVEVGQSGATQSAPASFVRRPRDAAAATAPPLKARSPRAPCPRCRAPRSGRARRFKRPLQGPQRPKPWKVPTFECQPSGDTPPGWEQCAAKEDGCSEAAVRLVQLLAASSPKISAWRAVRPMAAVRRKPYPGTRQWAPQSKLSSTFIACERSAARAKAFPASR